MKAVLFPKAEEISVERVDDPVCGPEDVIVQIAVAGICGTDVHIYRNEYMSNFPLIPGHEFGGTVVEVGKEVKTGVKVGDRVVADPNLYCGYCDFCRREQSNHCTNIKLVGVTRAGAFAEYVSVPARACYQVPDSLTPGQMALVEPLACVVYGMKRAQLPPAEAVLIFGAGPIGLLLLQALRHRGAGAIVVVDKQADRLAMAKQFGATVTLEAGPDLPGQLKELQPYGFGMVVDATGVPAVIERCFDYLRPRGQLLMFGVAPMGAKITMSPYAVFRNDWHILSSFAICYTFQEAIAWIEHGVVDVQPLISHTLPIGQFEDGFNQFMRGQTMKVQIVPGQ